MPNITRKTLLRSIEFERGELYSRMNGRRCLFARCTPRLEIYEHETTVPILGEGRKIKKVSYSLVICQDLDLTRPTREDDFSTVTVYDLSAQILKEDGVYQVITFDNIIPSEIHLDGDWIFETQLPEELKKII
ncbi:MAG: hypothetical protein LUH07_02200 [Lachnospiraceae bacterium]|nr:hypothetical protein [Lachnospiraceae bacterium]